MAARCQSDIYSLIPHLNKFLSVSLKYLRLMTTSFEAYLVPTYFFFFYFFNQPTFKPKSFFTHFKLNKF